MRLFILVIAIAVIVGAIVYLESGKPSKPVQVTTTGGETAADIPLDSFSTASGAVKAVERARIMPLDQKIKNYERAKEIVSPSGFVNTNGITIKDLIGKKVILVDFWTYSCINCQRTTPYLNAWYEKYKDNGLEIIGIHTPEFGFEKDHANVEAAVKKFGIKYPVVQDNDYGTWNAYGNRYWPHKYLIDIDGFIVYDHIGEGFYDETERKIQELLEERSRVLRLNEAIAKDIAKPKDVISLDTSKPISPEIYFGAARNDYLGNGEYSKVGEQTLSEPSGFKTNILYLAGDWNFTNEFVENRNSGAKIIFRYQGKNVYIVASSESGVNLKVLRDGKPLSSEKGGDVVNADGQSTVKIKGDRLYKIIEDPAGYGEHTLEIIIENPGLKAFTFTFG